VNSSDGSPRGDSFVAECEQQRPQLTSAVQAHAGLLRLTRDSFDILNASENLAVITGETADHLLGKPVSVLIDSDSSATLRGHAGMLKGRPMRIATPLGFRVGGQRDGVLYQSGEHLCLEFGLSATDSTLGVPFEMTQHFLETIMRADSITHELAFEVCDYLRRVTGCDRAYYCVFDAQGNGYVPAEARGGELPRLLDHHFPASDLPQVVRDLYLVNPFRHNPDIDAEPAAILGGDAPLDLSLSTCRAMAPTHLEYLRNMGVRASGSFSVVRQGRLAGLFGIHHPKPLPISFRRLTACHHFVETYRSRSEAMEAEEQQALASVRLRILHRLARGIQVTDGNSALLSDKAFAPFVELMDADDLLVKDDDNLVGGRLLADGQRRRLLDELGRRVAHGRVFCSDSLARDLPGSFTVDDQVAGAFAFALDEDGRYLFAWLRRERPLQRKWKGDPDHAVVADASGKIGPRKSFETYERVTRGTCRPWEPWHHGIAASIRHALNQLRIHRYNNRQREAAEAANALKSEFLANISHELRSPLHSIMGLSDALVQRGDALSLDRRGRYASMINAGATRLLDLVNDLLDLAKLESGRAELRFEPTDMVAVARHSADQFTTQLEDKGLRLVIDEPPGVHAQNIDAGAIGQVFTNLFSNAIKFSPPGGAIEVTFQPCAADENGEAGLRIEVADQGVGIAEDELEAVFDKFIQSSRTKTGAGGTGLGLSICREIVERHGGRIHARSQAEGGATLSFFLPFLARGGVSNDETRTGG
jgi:light-regulated signal transduction histidine kinase (bacteriophytochrome)